VVSLDVLEMDTIRLQHEVILLRRRSARLLSFLRLVVIALKVSGISFARVRLQEGTAKLQLLRAIERSRPHLPLRTLLRAIGLSHARYHDRIRADRCGLDDRPRDPRVHFLNIGEAFLNQDGSISKEIMDDYLHLTQIGYEKWAATIEVPMNALLKKSAIRERDSFGKAHVSAGD
jgi:hypothetical protein